MPATDVVGHCQKNPGDFHVWDLKLKNGRPSSWLFPSEKSTDWTVEERERVFEALEETPAFLKDLDIDGIYRMKESVSTGNPAATHGADVVLYDKAFDPDFTLALVLDHELAHRLLPRISQADLKSFREAAKWNRTVDGKLKPERPANQFFRPNGRLSFEEDFCDDVALYLQQPQKLKALSPEIFQWMETHVGPKLKSGKHE